jgi:hypothetical protein
LPEGPHDQTRWEVCRYCQRADWANHADDCEGQQKLERFEAMLARVNEYLEECKP